MISKNKSLVTKVILPVLGLLLLQVVMIAITEPKSPKYFLMMIIGFGILDIAVICVRVHEYITYWREWDKKPWMMREVPGEGIGNAKAMKKIKLENPYCKCGWNKFYAGPMGGIARNVQCMSCGKKYNLIMGELEEI